MREINEKIGAKIYELYHMIDIVVDINVLKTFSNKISDLNEYFDRRYWDNGSIMKQDICDMQVFE